MEKISGRIEVDVPGTYCDPADIPNEEEDCRLFCPEECVVSEWTEWSSCLSVMVHSKIRDSVAVPILGGSFSLRVQIQKAQKDGLWAFESVLT